MNLVHMLRSLSDFLSDESINNFGKFVRQWLPPSRAEEYAFRDEKAPVRRPELNSSPAAAFSEAAGVVSTARNERPPLYRGGSASTETIPVDSHPLLRPRVARAREII
jgi:hypothetical protein